MVTAFKGKRSKRRLFLTLSVVVFLLAMASLNGIITTPAPSLTSSSDEVNNRLAFEILRSINEYRQRNNLPPLLPDSKLIGLAYNYSKWMATGGFFNHTAPGGFTLNDRIKAVGLLEPRIIYGENLALIERTAERRYISLWFINIPYYEELFTDQEVVMEVVKGWYDSVDHRKNMLNPLFTHVGVGVYEWSGRIYVTSIFKGYQK